MRSRDGLVTPVKKAIFKLSGGDCLVGGGNLYRIPNGTGQDLPEISIVVPVYDGAATLRACLEALQGATGPVRELILVDDGSEDGSAAIAESMGVRVVRHAHRRGC